MTRCDTTYDFIIVGAGSAGATLAARLSDDENTTVLLIEAGGPNKNPFVTIPMGFIKLFGAEPYFWRHSSAGEPELPDRSEMVMHGKGLGGSSSVNAMVVVRGHAEDFDEWSQLGNDGWSYSEVLPYFKRLESSAENDNIYRGHAGPITVRKWEVSNPLSQAFIHAVQETGHPFTPDYNGASQYGVSSTQHAITQGYAKRSSPLREYLRPAMHKKNLHVLTEALAARVLIKQGRAVGVEFVKNGLPGSAHASGEVILSAGAYKTPHLLLLSGIGPADHIRKFGIDPICDLPGVGQNLQDHLGSFVQHACTQPVTLYGKDGLWGQFKAAFNYLLTGDGPLSHYPADAVAFLKTQPELSRPDVQFYFSPFLRSLAGASVPSMAMACHGYNISWCQLRPESRGSVKLSSSDPFASPLISHNYLTAGADKDFHRRALDLARELHECEAFSSFRDRELDPGPMHETSESVDRYIRDTCHTHFHPVGTAAMGQDNMAVVDNELRIHGVGNLRVVDASIMPRLPGANTNIPTIMIAEKASDMIRNRAPLPKANLTEKERAGL